MAAASLHMGCTIAYRPKKIKWNSGLSQSKFKPDTTKIKQSSGMNNPAIPPQTGFWDAHGCSMIAAKAIVQWRKKPSAYKQLGHTASWKPTMGAAKTIDRNKVSVFVLFLHKR